MKLCRRVQSLNHWNAYVMEIHCLAPRYLPVEYSDPKSYRKIHWGSFYVYQSKCRIVCNTYDTLRTKLAFIVIPSLDRP